MMSWLAAVLFLVATMGFATEETLREQLQTRKAASKAKSAPEQTEMFERGVTDVKNSGVLESAKKTGDIAPGFKLMDATGKQAALVDFLKNGPVVLTWYRGGWCPYCNLALHAMQEHLAEIKAAGAALVAISPEQPDSSLTTVERHSLEFAVLSDLHNKVARDYGIVFTLPDYLQPIYDNNLKLSEYNLDKSMELPLAATYIIGTDGLIKWHYLNGDYRERAEPADIVAALNELK